MSSPTPLFDRVVGHIVNLEGGLSTNPADAGNWTGGKVGQGRLVGTRYGISAASYPELDIPNLTKEQAVNIYHKDYWLACHCDLRRPELGILVFDAAVQHGVEQANAWVRTCDDSPLAYMAQRIEFYTRLENFYIEDGDPNDDFGRGWMRRVASVMALAAQEQARVRAAGWRLVLAGPEGDQVMRLQPGQALVSRVSPDRQRIYLDVREDT